MTDKENQIYNCLLLSLACDADEDNKKANVILILVGNVSKAKEIFRNSAADIFMSNKYGVLRLNGLAH